MGKALYREYRPKRLTDVIGQEHVTATLANALKSGKVSHAYLFTGPRGTGKTTVARILAHEINGLDYTDDSMHLDIIEIDAASNRRIDEIRELRDRVHNAPTSVKYKVYIIDEVHMLTKEAFNALLKTLEEPPAHAIFILATTEVHKLPETIISRTQRFSMKPASTDNIVALLSGIAAKENFKISDEALAVIAVAGNGSFRDSVSLLDQARNAGDNISAEDAYRVLGIAPKAAVEQLLSAVETGPAAVVETLRSLRANGYQSGQLAKQLGAILRDKVLTVASAEVMPYIQLLHELLEVPYAKDIDAKLELVLIGFSLNRSGISPTATVKKIAAPQTPLSPEPTPVPATVKSVDKPKPDTVTAPNKDIVPTNKPTEESTAPEEQVSAPEPAAEQQIPTDMQPFSPQIWQQTLNSIKQRYNTLYGVVRMAQPEASDDTLVLKFAFAFHQKRINEPKNKQVVAQTIKELSGHEYAIQCVVEKSAKPPAAFDVPSTPMQNSAAATPSPTDVQATDQSPDLDTISNIFGGAEVLES